MNERLKQIEVRANKLEWNALLFRHAIQQLCRAQGDGFDYSESFYAAAERILSLYEPGPDITVTLNGINYKLVRCEDGH